MNVPSSILDKVLNSHAITEEAFEELKKNNTEKFITLRSEHLRKLEEKFMRQFDIIPYGQRQY